MTASNLQDYLVTGFTGGYDRPTQRVDYVITATTKSAAIARLKITHPSAKRVTARPTTDFKEINVYALFPILN